ncbi:MAG: winged helix-turn-helix domain-containing protein [Nostocoides sp.]
MPEACPGRHLSLAQARRIALAAQGFTRPRPQARAVGAADLTRVIDTVGVVQIDSVNVLTRSHYLPFFSRLGAYDTQALDRLRDRGPRRLVEYWAHEASLIPVRTWPLLDFRMRRAESESWGGMQRVAAEHPQLVTMVKHEVQRHGPLTARQVEARLSHEAPHVRQGWGWNWSLVKHALEHLFWAGQISSAGRTRQFERRYAALELVFPRPLWLEVLDRRARPSEQAAFVDLIRLAATAHGIGTQQCLRDYFRLSLAQAGPAIAELVRLGELEPVTVTGWGRPAYLHVAARRPRTVRARALLSPFDSLIWQRDRTRALFGFDYRLEIYTPADRRVHGYYVLPFLFGDALVARCDLKADRARGVLRVQRLTWEPDAPAEAASALTDELALMATWLGLTRIDFV